jgi:DNA helicase-2/ATP-dependent DNA helicase PcrA
MDILDNLNDAQKLAVKTTSGPLLILAGAGSGKTKTLTHRIAYLIAKENIQPNQIMAVTFTNKAAKEMRHRLGKLLGQNSESRSFMPWMGTFHGLCVRLLKIDGKYIGIGSNFVIYDEDDRQSLIKQSMKSACVDPKVLKPQFISSVISSSKNELVGPDEFEALASYPNQKQIAKIYHDYENRRKKAEALDFDDLLIEVVRLFKEVPEIKKKWSNNFKHILIDEYQDTNAAQYEIVKSLVGADKNICVVGDDWQSIYSWRGADFKNILNFEKDFPGASVIKLEQNYRSTGNILNAAQNVITKNKDRTDKKLWTDAGQGEPVSIHGVRDESEEAHIVAERVFTQVSLKARNYDDFAVLYRTNAQSLVMEKALINFRIPYRIVGGTRFYDRKEIKDIVAYLRLIYQPNDIVSFNRIANVPARSIGDTSLERFINWQQKTGQDILSSLENVHQSDGLTPRAKQAFGSLGNIIFKLRENMLTVNPAELIDQLLKMTGYKEYLNDGTPQAEERIENIGSLISEAQNYVTLPDYLEEVALMSSADAESESDKVTMMTLHAAKGLEFPVVFIVGLEEGILPHSRVFTSGKDADLEEERRLMYVGMTRARQELHLCYAMSRSVFGSRNYNPMSRFITDMDENYYQNVQPQTYNTTNDFEDEFDQSVGFDVGDRVRSSAFGNGEVIDVDGLALSIRFDNGSTKKLNVQFARLEKI